MRTRQRRAAANVVRPRENKPVEPVAVYAPGCPHPPELDCTDGACPAWWRGEEYGSRQIVKIVGEALDGPETGNRNFGSRELGEVVGKINAMKARVRTLEQRLRDNEDNEERFRWAKAREDEAKTGSERVPAIYCEHANEVPLACPCPDNCYCKNHTCNEFGTVLRQATDALRVVGTGKFRKRT